MKERQKLTHLIVEAEPQYWEDAIVNGVEDEDGLLIPFRDAALWKPVIRLADGRIEDWPIGTTAEIHYKVCDQGFYFLGSSPTDRALKYRSDYVPDMLAVHANGYGNYIIMNVRADGLIDGWKEPEIDLGCWDSIAMPNQPSVPSGQYPNDAEIEQAVTTIINPDAWPPHYVKIIRWACDWAAARHRDQTRHSSALMAAEEDGYARGLRDRDAQIQDMAMLLKRAAYALDKIAPGYLPNEIMIYIRKHGLLGSPLREESGGRGDHG